MDWPWTLWEIAVNLIENGLFVLLLTRQLGYLKRKKKYVFLGYFILVANITILNFTSVPLLPTVLIALAVQLVFALTVFQGSLPKRLLWGCSGTIIAQICNVLTVNLFVFFGNANIQESLSPTATRFEMMICYLLLYALFYFILAHIRPKRKIFLSWALRVILIAIFIIGLVAIQRIIDVYVFYTDVESGADLANISNNLIFVSAVIVGTFLSMLFMFEYIGSLAQKNLDAQAELQQTKWQNEHYKNVKDTYQALRSWKHDFQNHLEVMGTYLQKQKYAEMQKYLSQISTEIEPFMHLYTTGNDVADAVLSNKLFIAHSKGIRVNVSVVLPEKMGISDVQLCSVLSNLLDNAIEAQQSVAEPFINISIRPERGMLTMKIENSSTGNYNLKKRQLTTTKKEKGHGIGLQQVKKIVEDSRGILDIQPQADTFTVKILLPLDGDEDV
jgi:sensor histidine kinase YesM